MRLDIFLANLLFGLTLITAFMALAHILGDYICRKFEHDKLTKLRMRALLMLACLLIALFVFTEKLNNENGLRIAETNEPKLGMYLVKSEESENREASDKNIQQLGKLNSITLRNQPSAEALSEEIMMKSLLKRVTVQNFINNSSSGLCQSWRNLTENLNLKLKNVSKISMTMADATLVLLCSSDQSFNEQLGSISSFIQAGGSALIVGSVTDEKSKELLKNMLQINSWDRPNSNPPLTITFGGDLFSWGGMPSGLRFGLGMDWLEQKGALLAQTKPEYNNQVKTKFNSLTPLVMNDYGKGHLLWTSIPGQLSDRLNLLYSPYWNLMSARLLANLAGLPLLGVESLPTSSKKLILPLVHANYDSMGAVTLAQIFHDLGIKASFNLSISDVDGPNKIASQLLSLQQDINAIDYYPKEDEKNDFYSQLAYFYNWREAHKRLSPASSSSQSDFCCQLGVNFSPITKPSTIAAAIKVGFDFAIGFPYRDWITPYRLTTETTHSMQEQIFHKKSFDQSKNMMTVLPTFTDGDFSLENQTKGTIETDEIEKWLRNQINDSSWMGGPSVVSMHTHILGKNKSASNLGDIFKKLKQEKISFQNAKEYLTWWEAKSSLLWKITAPSSTELVFELKNPSPRTIKNISLKTLLNQWKVSGNTNSDEIIVDEIKPQEIFRLKLSKR